MVNLKMWKVLFLFSALSLEITSSQKRLYSPGNITIGVLLPIHIKSDRDICGDFYAFGVGYVEAIRFTLERINNDTTLLPNLTLGVDIWDYCDLPDIAVKRAHGIVINNYRNDLLELIDNGPRSREALTTRNLTERIVGVIGTEDSSSTSLVSSLLQVVGIATISPFATSEELSTPYYSKFFRTIPPDGQQAKAMVDIIEHFKWKYVAAVAVDHSYGRYGVRALEREAYDRRSFCIAFVEYFSRSGYMGKITTIIEKLKRESNIQVIVFWSSFEPAKRFLEVANAQGLLGRTFLMSEAVATVGRDTLEKHAAVLNGSLGLQPHKFEDPQFESHLKQLTAAQTRDKLWWDEFWMNVYGCMNSPSSSKSSVNSSLSLCNDSMTVSEAGFRRVYNTFVPYLIDAVYALAHAIDDSIQNCSDKGTRQGCPSSSSLRPDDISRYLANVNFSGVTGKVYFSSTGNPANSHYDVVHFRTSGTAEEFSVANVGSWRGSGSSKANLVINETLIHWNNRDNKIPVSVCSKTCPAGFRQTKPVACCWECLPCAVGYANARPGSPNCTKCSVRQMSNKDHTKCVALPIINMGWTDGTTIFFLILTLAGLAATLVAFGVFLIHQDTPVVKASNREMSYLLLLIIVLTFLLAVLHLERPSDLLCYVVQPYRYITCTACVSILFLKTNRLVRAFQTNVGPPWFKKYVLDRRRQLVVVFLLNSIQIIITGLWLGLDPPYKHEDIRAQVDIYITCLPFKTRAGNILRTVMFTYFIFVSLLCVFYAYKARKLPENFNEAKCIGFSMYVLLLSWITYYPVDSALTGSYITTVACSTALVIAYGLLGCMFGPKLYVILRRPEQNTMEFVKAEVGQFNVSVSFTPVIANAQRIQVTPSPDTQT